MFKNNENRRALQGLIIVAVFLLSSCLGIEVETVLNEDGSGRMTVQFRISQALLQIGEEESGVDIPLSKDDLVEEYEGVEGVTVVEVTEEDTEEDRIITAVIEFDDFNALSANDEFISDEASLETTGNRSRLSIMIGQADQAFGGSADGDEGPAEMDDAMLAMAQSFMEGYNLTYRIVAPRAIIDFSDGELQSDGRTLVYTIAMGDFVTIKEPFNLEINW